jgi:hypothetical protein
MYATDLPFGATAAAVDETSWGWWATRPRIRPVRGSSREAAATPLLALRSERCQSIEELLFVLMTLGDDRAVKATYVAGART